MQRQSLGGGSPSMKLHSNGVVLIKDDSPISSSISSSPDSSRKKLFPNDADDDDRKLQKKKLLKQKTSPPPPSSSSSSGPEKFIHLIPLLTLFCILILYLSSHDPSQSELAGFKHFSKPIDSTNIDETGGILGIEKGEVLGIRSMRNLQEAANEIPKRYRFNRKLGGFLGLPH